MKYLDSIPMGRTSRLTEPFTRTRISDISPFRKKLSFLTTILMFSLLWSTSIQSHGQCLTGSLYPTTTFTPTVGATCTFANINGDAWAGEYANVNVVSGNTYKFRSSIATDFITISNSAGTLAFCAGLSGADGLSWVSSITGVVRYYIHTNATCGTQNTNRTRSICAISNATGGGCLAGSLYPTTTFTPTAGATCTFANINTDAWAGEYANVNVVAGDIYRFRSSVATDFITISNTAGTAVYVANVGGAAGITWNATVTAVVRFYIHTNVSCGTQNTNRTRSVCRVSNCLSPTALTSNSITHNSANIAWTAPAAAPSSGYQYFLSTVNTPPTGTTTPTGIVAAGVVTASLTGLNPNTPYFYWVRSNCGSSQSSWTGSSTFTTLALPCTGTPNPGNTLASVTSGFCFGSTTNLSLQNQTTGSGVTYQWQSSTDNSTWTAISGATAATRTQTVTANTYYRCSVTCSGVTTPSNSVYVTGVSCGSVNVPATGSATVACGASTLIYDNGGAAGNYGNNSNGTLVLQNSGTGVITLTGTFSGIETCCDFLKVFQGVGTGGTQVASNNGAGSGSISYTSAPGTSLTIQFTADGSVNGAGFALQALYSGVCAPAATATLSTDCGNNQFYYSVNVTGIGAGPTVDITSSPASAVTNAGVGIGTYQVGPFANGTAPVITITSTSNPASTITINGDAYDCAWVGKNALDFDGVNDRVNCGTAPSVSITGTAITLEAWIYPTAFRTNIYDGSIINKEGINTGYMIRCGGAGVLELNLGTGSGFITCTSNTGALTLNQWQHVAGVYDGSTMKLYKNGSEIKSVAATASFAVAPAAGLTIGNWSVDNGRGFVGKIDEVRVWNVARSATEILNNQLTSPSGCTSGLAAYYTFDQGAASGLNTTVTSLVDATVNANTGTLVGFTLNGSTSNWVLGQYNVASNTPLNACTGVPSLGNTIATATSAVTGGSVGLGIQNVPCGLGFTYQWQVSVDNVTYTDITGATSPAYTATITAVRWYRCSVSCSGGVAEVSNPVQITITYCTPTGTSGSTQITNVTMTGITTLNNTSAGNAGYGNFTAVTPTVSAAPGATVPFTITHVSDPGVAIYIDWNSNYSWDLPGELVYTSNNWMLNSASGSFVVPANQASGIYRMRIVADWNSTNPISCPSAINGETEDYVIAIAPKAPLNPTITPGTPTCTSGVQLNFNGTPTAGTSWYWQTSATGTDLTNSASTNTVYANGTYYVRAYSSAVNLWSTASSVTVSTIPAPTMSLPASVSACVNQAQLIEVTAIPGDFDSFIWSPVTNLYTDAAATTAYTGGYATQLYFKGATPGAQPAITCTASNSLTNCGSIQNTTVTVIALPAAPVVESSATAACTNGTVVLTAVTGASSYCASLASYSADEEITNVTLGTLNNSSNCTVVAPGAGSVLARYANYTSGTGAPAAPTFTVGTPVTGSVTVGTCGSFDYTSGLAIFIDYNRDGDFSDAGERVWDNGALSNISCFPATVVPVSFTIPASALSGTTRMRIVNGEDIPGNSMSGCASGVNWGEVEDYNVTIVGGVEYTYAWTPALAGNTTSFTGTSQPITAPTTFTATVNNGVCTSISSNAVAVAIAGLPSVSASAVAAAGTYCNAISAGSGNITSVSIATTSLNATGLNAIAPNYYNLNPASGATTATLNAGSSYSLSVATASSAIVSVWIDYNGNGDFAASEWTQVYTTGTSGSVSISVPANALNGNTRMRIRSRLAGNANGSGNACTSLGSGTTEDFVISIANGSVNVPCPGSTFNLNAIASNGGAPYTYSWTVSPVGAAVIANPSAANTTAVVNGDAVFTVTVIDNCTSTATASASADVLENPLAISVTDLLGNPVTTVCGSPGTNLTATGGSNYTWTAPTNGLLSATTGSAVVFNTNPAAVNGDMVYSVAGNYGNNCSATATTTIQYQAPLYSISFTDDLNNPNLGSDNTLCGVAGTVNFTAVPSLPGTYSYSWSQGTGSTLSSTTGSSVSASIPATTTAQSYVYTVSVSDGSCVATGTAGVSFFTFTSFDATINGLATPSSVCLGNNITLDAGVSTTNFSTECISSPPSVLATPPIDAKTLILNGVTQSLATGVTNPAPGLDDGYFAGVPIGFNFNFFGQTATNVFVGTNGTVVVNVPGAVGSSAYDFSGGATPPIGFPSNLNPASTIAVCARDLNFNGGGSLRYWTDGVAPTRRFIVQYQNVPLFSNTGALHNTEAILYEGSGVVEINVISATNGVGTWAPSSTKYIGLQDATQTIGATARNCSTGAANYWNGVTNEITTAQAWRFNPPVNYTFAWTATPPASSVVATPNAENSSASTLAAGSVNYDVIITNPLNGCVKQDNVAVVVDPTTVAGTLSSNVTIGCAGITSGTITLSGNTGSILDWEFASPIDAVSWNPYVSIANTTNTLNFTNLTQTTRYRARVKSGSCSEVYTDPVVISVTPYPTAQLTGAATVCNASNAIFPIQISNTTGYTGTFTVVMTDGSTASGSSTLLNVTTSTVGTPISIASVTADQPGCTSTTNFLGTAQITLNTYYQDTDGDGYGVSSTTSICPAPAPGFVLDNGDCNDAASPSIYPNAPETCNDGIDQNCDGADEVCAGDSYSGPIVVSNIGQFGFGVQTNLTVNLVSATNSVESPGIGNDVWYSFVAQGNAVRIALTGSGTVADDNDLALYIGSGAGGGPLVPLTTENAVTPATAANFSPVPDGGSEIMFYDQLQPQATYYICVRAVPGSVPGICNLSVSYLRGSSADIGPFTGGTGVYNTTCANFKAAFRSQASGYTVKRWASESAAQAAVAPATFGLGTCDYAFAIPPQANGTGYTICQLGKILPANLTGALVNHWVTVDVTYNLKDAAGNNNLVTAYGDVASAVGLNFEAPLLVRSTDLCNIGAKRTTAFIATNRSVCGTIRYDWKFKQAFPTPGLPSYIAGGAGATRLVGLSTVPSIANGQRYDVWIRAAHLDGLSYTSGTAVGNPTLVNTWFPTSGGCTAPNSSTCGDASCVKLIGNAGMTLENNENVTTASFENEVTAMIFPNPNNGQIVNLYVAGMEGDLKVRVLDATGRVVYNNRYVVEGSINTNIDFGQVLAGGVYMVELVQNGDLQTMRMVVNR